MTNYLQMNSLELHKIGTLFITGSKGFARRYKTNNRANNTSVWAQTYNRNNIVCDITTNEASVRDRNMRRKQNCSYGRFLQLAEFCVADLYWFVKPSNFMKYS